MKKLLTLALLMGLMCGCSPRGAHMPKHRKKHHCNCPAVSRATTDTAAPYDL